MKKYGQGSDSDSSEEEGVVAITGCGARVLPREQQETDTSCLESASVTGQSDKTLEDLQPEKISKKKQVIAIRFDLVRECAKGFLLSDQGREVPDTDEWVDLVMRVQPSDFKVKVQSSHLKSALRLLRTLLVWTFRTPTLSVLKEANRYKEYPLQIKFAGNLSLAVHEFKWSKSTTRKMIGIIKKIFLREKVHPRWSTLLKVARQKSTHQRTYGKKYGRLAPEHPLRRTLDVWARKIREGSMISSELSMRAVMFFILNTLLPAFGLSLETWEGTESGQYMVSHLDTKMILKICGSNSNSARKGAWIQMFLTEIADLNQFRLPNRTMKKLKRISDLHIRKLHQGEDGSDLHKIENDDVDRLFVTACNKSKAEKSAFYQLLFVLFITTGLRISGVVRMKMSKFAELRNDKWVCLKKGMTLNKGNELGTVELGSMVREYMTKWLQLERPADPSPYIFPGRHGDHVSTSTVRKMFHQLCRDAILEGQQFHPHALRHTFAHIMKKSGVNIAGLQAMLHHKSTKTTSKYYIKESREQRLMDITTPLTEASDMDRGLKRKYEPPKCFQVIRNFADTKHQKKVNKRRMAKGEQLECGVVQTLEH
jgi:integrase